MSVQIKIILDNKPLRVGEGSSIFGGSQRPLFGSCKISRPEARGAAYFTTPKKWFLSRLQIYYSVPLYPYIQISLPGASGAAILLNPTKGTHHFCMHSNKLSRGPMSAYFHTSNPEHNQLEKLPPCVPMAWRFGSLYAVRRGYTKHQLVS